MLPIVEIVRETENGWRKHRRVNIDRRQPASITKVIGAEVAEIAEVVEVVEVVEAIKGDIVGAGVVKVESVEAGPVEVKATGVEVVKLEAVEFEIFGVEARVNMPGLNHDPCKAIIVRLRLCQLLNTQLAKHSARWHITVAAFKRKLYRKSLRAARLRGRKAGGRDLWGPRAGRVLQNWRRCLINRRRWTGRMFRGNRRLALRIIDAIRPWALKSKYKFLPDAWIHETFGRGLFLGSAWGRQRSIC